MVGMTWGFYGVVFGKIYSTVVGTATTLTQSCELIVSCVEVVPTTPLKNFPVVLYGGMAWGLHVMHACMDHGA